MQLPDKLQRLRAQDPHHSFIVQAPAGSGKTHLLTLRVLRLLAQVEIPEHILALTFTRRAASEMRHRIMQALHNGTGAKPQQAHLATIWELAQAALKHSTQQGWNLLASPNRLRIMTIDALAAACCKQLPTKTHIVASAQISDTPKLLYLQASTALLSQCHLTAEDQPHLYRLLQYYDNQPEHVVRLICDLLPRRDQWLHFMVQAAPRDLLEKSLRAIAEEKIEKLAACWQSAQENNPLLSLAHLQELLTYAASELPNSSPHTALLAIKQLDPGTLDFEYKHLNTQHLSLWQAICRLLLTDQATVRKQVTAQLGFPSPGTTKDKAEKDYRKQQKAQMQDFLSGLTQQPDLTNALIELQHCPPIKYNDTQWQLLDSLCYLLPRAVAHLQVLFNQYQVVDFVEINLQAQQALGQEQNPTDLALQLDYKLQHILVDEFQDTAYLHYNFLKQLVHGWQPGDGRSLFIVGDPMQSIYRFRDAEVSLFTQTQQHGLGDVALEALTLRCNFRSTAPLLDWINHACSQFFPTESDIASAAICYTPAQAAAAATSNESVFPVWIKAFGHDKQGAMQHEAQQIALQIKQILSASDKTQHGSSEAPSIAILARSRHHLPLIFQTLRQHGIKFQAIDIESLAQHPAILDLITLTRALMHPADEVAWYGVLRAPWCGLNLHSLYQLNQAQRQSSARYLSEFLQSNEDYSHIIHDAQQLMRLQRNRVNLLQTLKHQGEYNCISHWIKQCWGHCGGPAALGNASDLQFCDAFFDLLKQMNDGSGQIDQNKLMQRLQRAFMHSTTTDHTTSPAVQIMTIHKSKGLEFDHVFIPSLQASAKALDQHILQWLQQPSANGDEQLILAPLGASHNKKPEAIYHYLRELDKQKHHLESARLLYVALTRAKQQLYLCYYQVLNSTADNKNQPSEIPDIKFSQHSLLYLLQTCIPNDSKSPIIVPAINATQQAQALSLSRLTAQWPCVGAQHATPQPATPTELNHPSTISLAQLQGTMIHAAMEHLSQLPQPHWKAWIKQQQPHWAQQLCGFTDNKAYKQSLNLIEHTLIALQNCPFSCWALDNQQHINAYSERAYTDYTQSPPQQFIMDRTLLTQSNWLGAKDLPCSQWIIDYKCTLPDGLQLDLQKLQIAGTQPLTSKNRIINKNSHQTNIQINFTAYTQALMPITSIELFAQQQLQQHWTQLRRYAQLIHAMQPDTTIHIALYFPILQLGCYIQYSATQEKDIVTTQTCNPVLTHA